VGAPHKESGMEKKSRSTLSLVLLSLVLVFLNTDNNVLNPNISMVEKEFGVGDGDIGVMMGLFTILGAVISLLWGYLADKRARKPLFIICVVLGVIPCMATAFAPDYAWFFALRILTGIGVGATFPLVFSLVGDLFDQKRRAMATAIVTTAISVGNILGIVLGGYTAGIEAGQFSGWRLSFLLASAPNIPLILLFAWLIPEPARGGQESALKDLIDGGQHYRKTIKPRDYLKLARIKTNLLLFFQGLLGTIPWGATAFFNKFLEDNKGLDKASATTVFLCFALGMVAGNVAGGALGGRLRQRSPALVPWFCALTTIAGCLMVIAIFQFVPAEPVLLSLCGFAATLLASMTGPNMRTMLLDTNAPENRGAIFSIFNLTDSLGTGIGKFVAGMLSVAIGLLGSMTLCFAFWLGCGLILAFASRTFPADIKRLDRDLEDSAREMRQA
jgi:predicted MFS family arabinose efflux permease